MLVHIMLACSKRDEKEKEEKEEKSQIILLVTRIAPLSVPAASV